MNLPGAAWSSAREPGVWRPKRFTSHRGIIEVEVLPRLACASRISCAGCLSRREVAFSLCLPRFFRLPPM